MRGLGYTSCASVMSGIPSKPPPIKAPPTFGFNGRYGLPGADPAGNGEPRSKPPLTTWQGPFTSAQDGVRSAATRGAVPDAPRILAAILLGLALVTAVMNWGVSM